MKRFYHIELLRFFAAAAVIITHYVHFYFPFFELSESNIFIRPLQFNENLLPFYSFLEIFYRFGYAGVFFFWQISGFVLAFTYLNNERYKVSFKEFFINRFARLYPLHLIGLLLVILLQYISLKILGSYQITENEYYNGVNNLKSFFLHLTFLSGWFAESKMTFNFPIWSVSIEIVLYFLFFFLLIYLFNHKLILTIAILLLFLILEKADVQLFFFSCGRYFFSGVLVFVLLDKIKNKNYILLLSLIFLALSFLGNFKYNIFFTSILLFAVFLDFNFDYKVKKYLSTAGNLTYASYVLHIPFQLFIILFINFFNINYSIFTTSYFLITYLIGIFCISYLSYRFVENPLRNSIRKLNIKK